jgi:capsular exopolysaccharide synthesis family protein
MYITVKSPTEFLLFENGGKSNIDRSEGKGVLYAFGDKIDTNFGGFVITPNTGQYAPKVGSTLKIQINPVSGVAGKYTQLLGLSTSEGSNIVNIEIIDAIPQKAIDIVNEVIKAYNNDVLRDKEEVVRITSEFIDNRLQQVSEELEEVDYTAEELQKRNKLTALNSQADINLQTEKATEAKIAQTTNRIQLIEFLQEEMKDDDKASDMLPADIGIGDNNTAQITQRYNELVAQRDRLLKTSSERNPVVVNLNDQIKALKGNLMGSLQNMKESSMLTLNNLNSERSRISGQLYAAPTKARQFRDIKRQQDIKESLYLYLLQRREESAIKLGMYTPVAKIVDGGFSTFKPVEPNPLFTYIAAVIFGLALPMGIIYLSDLLNTKIYRKEDLMEILNIPYLGDVPQTSKKEKLINKVDYSPKAEAFRIIRSNVDFILSNVEGRAKKLFVTSTRAQEGKSHTSTNLASSISFSEKKVLLIEMDIRVPKILDYLGVDSTKKVGLSDYIADKSIKPESIIVKHKDNKYLDIIPSGTIPPNPSELLMSDRIPELFKHFESKYDYIVVDTSAVGIVSDTLLIANFADIFIYVVSADGIDKRLLKHVAQPLYDENRLPRMTLLLNGTKTGKEGYGYGYGYGNNPSKSKKKWYQIR